MKVVLGIVIAAGACVTLGALWQRKKESQCHVLTNLEVRDVLTVPDSLTVSGVALHRSGVALVWTHDRKLYRIAAGGAELRLIEDSIDVVAADFDREGSTFVALTRHPAAIIHLDMERGVTSATSLSVSGHLAEAVLHDSHWYVAEEHSDGRWRVLDVKEHGPVATLLSFGPSQHLSPTQWFRLGVSTEALFVTRTEWPFEVLKVLVTDRGRGPLVSTLSGLDTTLIDRGWVSLPTLPVGCGTLQTLADRRSHRRMLVLRDKNGEAARIRELDVPMGFTASLTETRLLVGMRSLASREVVSYSW